MTKNELEILVAYGMDLSNLDLSEMNLNGAMLNGAMLDGADLDGASLDGASLNGASLDGASLNGALLDGAQLNRASLDHAALNGASLNRVIGLLNPTTWLENNFERTEKGYIVYKIKEAYRRSPTYWRWEERGFLEEEVNYCRTNECGSGVNFATLEWIRKEHGTEVWKCLLHWEDLATLCVSYNTDGNARCGRLELLELLNDTSTILC